MSDRIAYFDNAATTFPKPDRVYAFADAFYRENGGNIGRGNHTLAANAAQISLQAKENLKTLYGCPRRKVVFTSSATDALNRIILGLGLNSGDNVFVSPFEHNAVTRPLHYLSASIGINILQLPFDSKTLEPDFCSIKQSFSQQPPSLVVMTHASNVCGAVLPVLEIGALAKEYGARVLVDMSQTAGLLKLDLASPTIDFAVFAGHKTLYAPFGIGGFFCRAEETLSPVFFGGNGINSIEQSMPTEIVQMEEIGSQNTYAIAGLKESTEWQIETGFEEILSRESTYRDRLLELLRHYDNIKVIGASMTCPRIGIVSVLFDSYSPDEIEMILSRRGIAVRSGLHCAPYAHRFLGTLPAGTVRFSIGAMTRSGDYDILASALEEIAIGG